MQILFLIFCLLLAPYCAAAATDITSVNDYQCIHLHISIKNETPNTCYLLMDELTNGSSMNNENLVYKILPNTESAIMKINPGNYYAGASIELVYECGDGAYVRVNSEKNACTNPNRVETSVLYSANLIATAETEPANYWANKPAKVIWTFK